MSGDMTIEKKKKSLLNGILYLSLNSKVTWML